MRYLGICVVLVRSGSQKDCERSRRVLTSVGQDPLFVGSWVVRRPGEGDGHVDHDRLDASVLLVTHVWDHGGRREVVQEWLWSEEETSPICTLARVTSAGQSVNLPVSIGRRMSVADSSQLQRRVIFATVFQLLSPYTGYTLSLTFPYTGDRVMTL